MAKNRYIGDYPVIGIRPIIDGRRGPLKVRESLEEQTMNMAKAAAKLFEENTRCDAQRAGGKDIPPRRVERIRNGPGGRRFQSVQKLRTAVQKNEINPEKS